MTPGSVVLLHAPHGAATVWGDLPEMLRSYGLDVIAPTVADETGPRYVARASLIVAAADPSTPLVLVGHGAAGPLLPAFALAQRAAHRKVGGYVFVDADLPRPQRGHEHDHEGEEAGPPAPVPADWPDAPCGYLWTHADRTGDPSEGRQRSVREARLRGWQVVEHEPPTAVAQSLSELIATL